MCRYYKKAFTCGHLSRVYIDRCVQACTTNKKCNTDMDIEKDEFNDKLRREATASHFECYDCMTASIYANCNEAATAAAAEEQDPVKLAEIAQKQERYISKIAKAQANREKAAESMKKERERDRKREEECKKEEERSRRGDGTWTESKGKGKGKGRRGKKGGGNAPPPLRLLTVFTANATAAKPSGEKPFGGGWGSGGNVPPTRTAGVVPVARPGGLSESAFPALPSSPASAPLPVLAASASIPVQAASAPASCPTSAPSSGLPSAELRSLPGSSKMVEDKKDEAVPRPNKKGDSKNDKTLPESSKAIDSKNDQARIKEQGGKAGSPVDNDILIPDRGRAGFWGPGHKSRFQPRKILTRDDNSDVEKNFLTIEDLERKHSASKLKADPDQKREVSPEKVAAPAVGDEGGMKTQSENKGVSGNGSEKDVEQMESFFKDELDQGSKEDAPLEKPLTKEEVALSPSEPKDETDAKQTDVEKDGEHEEIFVMVEKEPDQDSKGDASPKKSLAKEETASCSCNLKDEDDHINAKQEKSIKHIAPDDHAKQKSAPIKNEHDTKVADPNGNSNKKTVLAKVENAAKNNAPEDNPKHESALIKDSNDSKIADPNGDPKN